MSKVLCFGEALIDFLNNGGKSEDGLTINNYSQYPGGAPANAAVAAAKLGGSAAFVGQVGSDMFGDFIEQALMEYGVNTRYLKRHPLAKTALAFVHRDDSGERQFSFYRQYSADILYREEQADEQMFTDAIVFHICSNTLTDSNIAFTTEKLIARAKAANTLISFDINLRHNLWSNGVADKHLVKEFVSHADVLKFSREEIEYLTDHTENYVNSLIENGAKLVIITNDGGRIYFYTASLSKTVLAPKVDVVDTTAGGDGFVGGLLYLISQLDNFESVLADSSALTQVIKFAAACGAHAVTQPGAFPALPTLPDVNHAYPTFMSSEND